MLSLERHSLLTLSGRGRDEAEENRILLLESDAAVWAQYPAIPAIFTGRRTPGGLLQIGFSYPVRDGKRRVRIASAVSETEVLSAQSPWEVAAAVAEQPTPLGTRLRQIRAIAENRGVRLGLFGAAAMEGATGLGYLHRESDLDLLIDRAPYDALKAFSEALADWEYESGSRSDAELRLSNTCYCKLRELLREQSTVLCRGGEEPLLLPRNELLKNLSIKN